jgi:hypothetical protein
LKNIKEKDIFKNLAHYMQSTDRQDLDPLLLLDLELAMEIKVSGPNEPMAPGGMAKNQTLMP